MADYNKRLDWLATKIDSGSAKVKAQTTMLTWMNGMIIGGVAAMIINTFFT